MTVSTTRRPRGPATAALDVLLTDAAVGNPAQRAARHPIGLALTTARLARHPDRLARRAGALSRELTQIVKGTSEIVPPKGDKRFADSAWQKNWYFRRLAQAYLATGEAAQGTIDDAELDWRADTMLRFFAGNLHDLVSPTNFVWSNPAVMKETLDQGGLNLVKGIRRAGRDIGARRLPAMVDTSRFEVGGNLALTPGAVVLRTDVFELIQYAPSTTKVREVPLLVVPPTINKFYILDLSPGRSVVEYLLAQGQQVFIISWRNPGVEQADLGIDAYADAIRQARDAVAEISRSPVANLAAACSGGLLSASMLAHLADRGELGGLVGSLTLWVSALDNREAGTSSAMASRELAAAAVAQSARHGYLEASALANVFAWLRPNDLVWGYVVNNYLMGRPLPAFDILYWNQDGVRLSAGLHRDFVEMALDNLLARPGAMRVLGSPVDLGRVAVDTYVLAGLNDHIVPWENAYRGARLFGGASRFVLSTSGHIQALVNPPTGWKDGPDSRSTYRAADELPPTEEAFLDSVPVTSGSWWPDYARWLHTRSGDLKPARKTLGAPGFKPVTPAPGIYVHES